MRGFVLKHGMGSTEYVSQTIDDKDFHPLRFSSLLTILLTNPIPSPRHLTGRLLVENLRTGGAADSGDGSRQIPDAPPAYSRKPGNRASTLATKAHSRASRNSASRHHAARIRAKVVACMPLGLVPWP